MQCFFFVGYVMQIERDGDVVKGIISKRQGFCVGLNIFNVVYDVDIVQFFVVYFEYRIIDISKYDVVGFFYQVGEFGC